jgi:Uma2 family endonuclease
LKGVIVEMPPEGPPHASKRTTAQEYLMQVFGQQVQVRVAAPITLPDGSEPEPDLAIVERVHDHYLAHHPYPENVFWVIEYSNASLGKDLGVKASIYAEVGIQEYWVINLRKLRLIVFRNPVEGEYQSRVTLSEDIIRPLAFPEVAIEVVRLLG